MDAERVGKNKKNISMMRGLKR